MPTIRDVAIRAGVSVATVSAVVNGSRPVSPDLADRVQAAIRELDYHPNQIARALQTRRTKTLAMLVPSLDNPFFSRLLKAAEDRAQSQGYSVLVGSTNGDPSRALLYGARLLALGVDGVLATLSWDIVESGLLGELARRGTPGVGVAGARVTTALDCFIGTDARGAAEAVRYLISLGHREIAFVGAEGSRSTELRYAGYQDALTAAGLPVRPELRVLARGYTEADARVSALGLLAKGCRFTSVLAFNDVMAMGVQNALIDQGFDVPGAMSVIGFDDTVAVYTRPKLTTVGYPAEELSARATDRLLARLGGDDSAPRVVEVATTLVVRESTRSCVI